MTSIERLRSGLGHVLALLLQPPVRIHVFRDRAAGTVEVQPTVSAVCVELREKMKGRKFGEKQERHLGTGAQTDGIRPETPISTSLQ